MPEEYKIPKCPKCKKDMLWKMDPEGEWHYCENCKIKTEMKRWKYKESY